MEFLGKLYHFTGLEVNKSKSFFVNDRPNGLRDTVIKWFQKTILPLDYLGCPLHKGRTTNTLFLSLINKLQNKLGGWKGKVLSMGEKLILL